MGQFITNEPRDYVAEMNQVIGELLENEGEFIASVAASRLHDWLREHDPDLLSGWLRVCATGFLTGAIANRDRAVRARLRRRGVVGEPVDGDPPNQLFKTHYVVDQQGTRRPLGGMTGPDHLFVSGRYGRAAFTNQMLAKFHQAVAERVGERTTGEVMDEQTYWKLYRSVGGSSR
jgi:hypothetical protein